MDFNYENKKLKLYQLWLLLWGRVKITCGHCRERKHLRYSHLRVIFVYSVLILGACVKILVFVELLILVVIILDVCDLGLVVFPHWI